MADQYLAAARILPLKGAPEHLGYGYVLLNPHKETIAASVVDAFDVVLSAPPVIDEAQDGFLRVKFVTEKQNPSNWIIFLPTPDIVRGWVVTVRAVDVVVIPASSSPTFVGLFSALTAQQ